MDALRAAPQAEQLAHMQRLRDLAADFVDAAGSMNIFFRLYSMNS